MLANPCVIFIFEKLLGTLLKSVLISVGMVFSRGFPLKLEGLNLVHVIYNLFSPPASLLSRAQIMSSEQATIRRRLVIMNTDKKDQSITWPSGEVVQITPDEFSSIGAAVLRDIHSSGRRRLGLSRSKAFFETPSVEDIFTVNALEYS